MTIARHRKGALAAPFALLLLAGCVANETPAAPPPPPGGGSICEPARAQALVGSPRVTDEEARQRTGASLVRQIRPGDPITMDFQDTRVTITTDPASGVIREAACG